MQTLKSKKKWAAGAAILCAAVMIASAGFLTVTHAETPAESAGDDAALAKLQEVNSGYRALSRNVMRGLVRIKLEQNPESLLSKDLKSAWEETLRNPRMNRGGGGGPGRFEIVPGRPGAGGNPGWGGGGGGRGGPGGNQPGRDQPGRDRPGRDEDRRPATTAPASAPLPKFTAQSVAMLEEFLRSRMTDQDATKASDAQIALTKLRALRQTFNGDMYANVYDDSGHAFLMAAVALAPDKSTMHAYLPDGTEMVAKLSATNFIRGFSVLKIEDKNGSPTKATFNKCAKDRPDTGELVMTLSPNSGAIQFGVMPMAGFGKKLEPRFPFGGTGFIYNSRGEFAGFVAEGIATHVSALADEMKVLEEGNTIHPRSLGVRYEVLAADAPERSKNKLLGTKPVVKVTTVIKESLGEKADIQKDDYIVAIDGQSVTQLQRVLEEWQSRGTELKFEIVRGDQNVTKTIKAEKSKE